MYAGEERLKLVEQVEVLADAIDDVPDLVGVIREDCNQLEAAVALHVADRPTSVGFVVAQVHSCRSDGGGQVAESGGDLDCVVHRILVVYSEASLPPMERVKPNDRFPATANCTFMEKSFVSLKPAEILRKCGVS